MQGNGTGEEGWFHMTTGVGSGALKGLTEEEWGIFAG
jgi:hypothetical protein